MVSNIFTWFLYIADQVAIRPIQPQARLKPENQPLVVPPPPPIGSATPIPIPTPTPSSTIPPPAEPTTKEWDEIITGVYGIPPLLKIHDRTGQIQWTWSRDDVTQELPPQIRDCLYSDANDATEVKWIRNGTQIAAIYSDLVLIVNHTPEQPEIDKRITFATCRQNEFLWNSHTLEPLPGDRVAVATTGSNAWDGILVYNASVEQPLVDDPPILQNLTGLRAIHGMIWDETEQMLWAAGTDAAADGSDPIPAYGTIQGYPLHAPTGELIDTDHFAYRLPEAWDQETEWGPGYPWWCGPHDLVPVPHQRKFLMSQDRGLHAFDLNTREFYLESKGVVAAFLRGFEVTTHDRHGFNRAGDFLDLPESDLKSFSLAPDGTFLYVQSLWRLLRGNHTNLVVDRIRHEINEGDEIYRSRWFADIPGWPKPA
ncbi:hypothetical protein BDV28DRAFT_133058 [Aspergillus coremiiformis]|uniref:ASST-domain-containing protein n=1 Tax=Aspergillus coremiiformis TaxID=138285 RepID=A0A5N6Z8E9_9EURO|nr:hypothetical protein BDV28DRAFT_133058 [Aspergillus coremiiformis]